MCADDVGALSPGWTNAYVSPPVPFLLGGRDRDGWDCWGLVRVAYRELFGIELPSFAGEYETGTDPVIPGLYESVRDEWLEVEQPEPADVAWMVVAGLPCHVGLYCVVNDAPYVLHALAGSGTRMDRIETPAWSKRVRAYYRHPLRPRASSMP